MPTHTQEPEKATFVETALKLSGKSDDEAKRTGALDRADEQVEAMFAKKYQTGGSPVHRAVWEDQFPIELFVAPEPTTPPECQKVMDASLEVVRRHGRAKTLLDGQRKITDTVLRELGDAGYWGLLVDREYGGSAAPFIAFARFLRQMATVDPTVNDDVTSADRWELRGETNYKLTARGYLFGTVRYEDDAFTDYEYQATLAGGYG